MGTVAMALISLPARQLRRLIPAIFILAAVLFLTQQYLGVPTARFLPGNAPVLGPAASCAAHGYTPYEAPSNSERKRYVYDLIMVNTELDFLEIRLNTLYDHVDYFVVVESPKTFQMGAKDLILKQNWDRFAKYHDKIIYHQLQFPEGFNPPDAWEVENLQRDAMFDQVLPYLTGVKAPVYGDVILVSDVDEIPRPSTVNVLRACHFPLRLTLYSRFYYYSFQFLHDGREWQHPQATIFRGKDGTIRPTHLRNGNGGIPILREFQKGSFANSTWHCSSCFSTVAEFQNKTASFSHVWMNNEKYRDPKRIAEAVRNGKDVWGRRADTFHKLENNRDLPDILLKEGDRFPWLIDRSQPNAGFTDYQPSS